MTPGQEPTRCPTCDDFGRIADDPCPTCCGKGFVRQCPVLACHKIQMSKADRDPCLFCEAEMPSARPTYRDVREIQHMRLNLDFGPDNFLVMTAPPIPDEDVIA